MSGGDTASRAPGGEQKCDMLGELKLFGMKGVHDETLATAIKRKHEPQRRGFSGSAACDLTTGDRGGTPTDRRS
jgi:hypothetical protein